MSNSKTTFGELKMLAASIPRGRTASGQSCPFCHGGKHGEKALSITVREDGVALFLCHRASCGRCGRIFLNGNVSHNAESEPVVRFTPRPYTGETRQLNAEERTNLDMSYGITYREVNFHRLTIDKSTGRLVVPIIGPRGQPRGSLLSTLPGDPATPKALVYKERDEPFNGWFWTETSRPSRVVVVEDCISAIRVARQFPCVALIGTNISMDALFDILNASDHIVLALDRDASQKALEYQRRFKFIAPQMQVALLDKDLKWVSDTEIRERVNI